MPVILRFSGSSDLTGLAVKFYTWSWCSHVEVVLDDPVEGRRLYGALPSTGVNYRPTDATANLYTEEYEVKLPLFSKYIFVEKLLSQRGKSYDWSALIGMIFHRDWGTKHSSWFCSELICWAFAEAGHPLLRTEHKNRITPANLLMSPYLKRIY